MDKASTQCRVRHCSECPGDTGYYCVSCPCDLCPQCKENHAKDLKTINHNVVSHRDQFNHIPKDEYCVRHQNMHVVMYCKSHEVPVCFHCIQHKDHRTLDIKTLYKTKRQQYRRTIHTIRSEALFYRPALLKGIKADVRTCQTDLSLCQSEMLTKAHTLKNLIDKGLLHVDFKHRCLKQKREISRHIVNLQIYERIYEQPAFKFSALHFLSSIKTAFPQIHFTLHTSQLSMTKSFNKEDVTESLSAIHITERGNRRIGNQCLLKLMSGAEFHQSFTVTGVDCCFHFSCVTSGRVWVSDYYNLILTNTTGVPLHLVKDLCSDLYGGLHTVNSENELIYIDRKFNINKLSKDMKTTTTFIKGSYFKWRPHSVYSSPSTGDLLVAMCYIKRMTGKVTRYNQSGQQTQTIQHDNTGRGLYVHPNYITENKNGDVVVSDCYYRPGAVVVTERGGTHRFSYTGHPPGSQLQPRGICTDALSHILVCDVTTKTVQILNKDGQFLSRLQTESQEIGRPRSLSYDVSTHCIWVGSEDNNKLCVYRYITRQDALTDEHRPLVLMRTFQHQP